MPHKMLEAVVRPLSLLKDKKSLRNIDDSSSFFIVSFKHAQICYNRTRKLNKTEGYTLPLYIHIKEYYQLFTNFK